MIEAPELSTLKPIRHGFFTRAGGVSTGLYASLNCGLGSEDDKAAVRENRSRAAARLAVPAERLVTAWQYHSADVLSVSAPWDTAAPPKADGLVTATPGLALGILTADCAPVLFADAEAGVIGAAHAGWQGALNGVTDATLAAMEALGGARQRIVAVIGPTISANAYEVGPEFVARFEAQDLDNQRFFRASEKPGHAWFDLPGYLVQRLTAAGVGQAINLDLCTYANADQFFSYRRCTHRREAGYGRQISAITLSA